MVSPEKTSGKSMAQAMYSDVISSVQINNKFGEKLLASVICLEFLIIHYCNGSSVQTMLQGLPLGSFYEDNHVGDIPKWSD